MIFNDIRNRKDMERAAVSMLEPLIPLLSPGKARLHLGETGAVYSPETAEIEAFARPLWAIIPMLAGKCESVYPIWEHWKQGIINGTDPAHPEYWGDVPFCEQRLVEMAVFGTGMLLAPDSFFFSLPEYAQDNLCRWLDWINKNKMPDNNWTFFRVLVNMGFKTCGRKYNEKRLKTDLKMIEKHYDGDGWYIDCGQQIDYYTPWAFHYYGLIYAKMCGGTYSAEYMERAELFAADFAEWFDESGEGIPYGRSLIYRFAQSAFFSAMAFAEVETDRVNYGVMKHILLGNLRKWLSLPIFTRDGVLTIGYHYPNLIMAEGYNAPGSPYWAMKVFLVLALGEDHPFWKAEECKYAVSPLAVQPHMRHIISRDSANTHVISFPAGNVCHEHTHPEAKYEKFAYSTLFGFSVPKSGIYLHNIANDSMLAFSEDGVFWHKRFDTAEYEICSDHVRSVWQPFDGVKVETRIYPKCEWHIRIHRIKSERKLIAAEGGFAVDIKDDDRKKIVQSKTEASVTASWGSSLIRAVKGYRKAEMSYTEPNTNLFNPRTRIPMLYADIPVGETTLVCAVYGSASGICAMPDELKRLCR